MKAIIYNVILFCLFSCTSTENKSDEWRSINAIHPTEEYLLNELKIIKPFKKNIFTLNIKNNNIPYVNMMDSVFYVKVNDDDFIMYYNSSMVNDAGYLLYGSFKNKMIKYINTEYIIDSKILINNRYLILKLTENINNYPIVLRTSYFCVSRLKFSNLNYVSFISESNFLYPNKEKKMTNVNDLEINSLLIDNFISIKGIVNECVNFSDTIKINDGNFEISPKLKNIIWNNNNSILQNFKIIKDTIL